ncbi:hypothetical protein Tcan_04910 [Toxocara canis]|uniref:Protein quiver n=2 Tax=Toxocara canis TaxID=6265 RepID=A0A0B2VNC1_TOXCA|nr:hypothetical protein Tcan_04910 [Toxocara canis]VDM47211.1 unnamed protein product [Toxocara canis]
MRTWVITTQMLCIAMPTLLSSVYGNDYDEFDSYVRPADHDYVHHSASSDAFPRTFVSDTARCFSCMSKLYEAVWPALASIYKRPKNFTDRCNDDEIDARFVPITHCPTICIRMWEEPIVAGVRIKGHIRGCLDDLLHNGFNQTIVTWYRWMHRDSCRQYRKRELFKLSPEQSDESYISVCTCYADYCNGSATSTASRVSLPIFLLFYLLTVLPVHRL